MNKDQFIHIQDFILDVTGKALAARIGADPASITRYRSGGTIPDYIAKAMEREAEIALGNTPIPLTFAEILRLSERAVRAGKTFAEYITDIITADLARTPPKGLLPFPEEPSSRVAEQPTPYRA